MSELRCVIEDEDYESPARWRWRLSEPGGRTLAEHQVRLNTTCWEYRAFANLWLSARTRRPGPVGGTGSGDRRRTRSVDRRRGLRFGTPGRIHHVGISLGSTLMVNAPTYGQPVQVADLREFGDYAGASRLATTSAP